MKPRNNKITFPAAGNRYAFSAKAETATIDIFGEIDEWWGFGVREMALNLAENKGKPLHINIHSPGGSVTEGFGISNLIASHDGPTKTIGVGFVASIASIILLSADRATMARNAYLMIHNPWSFAIGDSDELRKTADTLDKMESSLAGVYAAKMQGNGNPVTVDEVKTLMANETWYTAEEALAAGLIDEIAEPRAASNTAPDAKMETLAKFSNIPQALAETIQFSNKNTNDMAKDKKSLFAQIGELFATAADEINEPETVTETPAPEVEETTTTATIDMEEMKKLLEENGYTVNVAQAETPAPVEEITPAPEEAPEVAELRAQVAELTKAVKRKVGTPSGGAVDAEATEKNKRPRNAMPFFDNLANVIKTHRPG